MATKKFLLEIEVGRTHCVNCPFENGTLLTMRCFKPKKLDSLNCSKYNLATMKIKEYEED